MLLTCCIFRALLLNHIPPLLFLQPSLPGRTIDHGRLRGNRGDTSP